MEMMRVASLYGPKDFRIQEMEKPQIIGEDGVLVRLRALGVCGSNLHWWEGYGLLRAGPLSRYPMLGGGCHEFCGEVMAVGGKVTKVQVGNRVGIDQAESAACGSCFYCAIGQTNGCEQRRPTSLHGFVEYMSLYERGLYKLPDHVSMDEGSLLEPFGCSVRGVRRAVTPGDTVAVLGAGNMGLFAIAAAKYLGASKVIATYKYDFQAGLAEACGADVVLHGSDEDIEEKVRAEANRRGPDVVVETVGGWANTLQQAANMVRRVGKVVLLGLFNEKVPLDSWQMVGKEITLIGSVTHCRLASKTDYELALEMIAKGKLPSKEIVTHRFPLEELNTAFEAAMHKGDSRVVKVVINP